MDFEQRRTQIFKSAPVQLKAAKENVYTRLRNKFVRGKYTASFVATVAYLRSIPKIHKQYFVIKPLQLTYVRILKAGSTSILRQILPFIDLHLKDKDLTDRQIDELGNQHARTFCEKQERNYKYFTVVRNPFHRLVSVYLDLFDPQHPFFYQTYLFGILKKEMSFTEFVQTLYQIPDALKSSHFIPQFHVVKLCGGKERIKCFRLEKDRLALTEFLQQYGITIDHSNKHKINYDYRTYYDLNTVQMVHNMYKMDTEEFDYREEYKSLLHYHQA